MELLTNSRLRAARTCARLHHYLYVEGWRPVRESEALRIGTLVHLGLEAWFRAHQDGLRDQAFDCAVAAVADRAWDAYEQAKIEEMLWGYDLRWRDQELEVLAVETEFCTKLLNPDTWAPSRIWVLAGKIDGIIRVDGRVLVIEHKTAYEEIEDPAADYWTKLQMDHQVSAYTIGAEALGYEVQGCLYDVLKKPALRPSKATPPEKRKYKKDGTLYASQREEDETPDSYRARLREEIEGNLPRYYARNEVVRMNSQIEEFMWDAWNQARGMHEMERAAQAKGVKAVPRAPERCHLFGTCSFWPVCSTGTDPSTFTGDFERLENKHPELSLETVNGGT